MNWQPGRLPRENLHRALLALVSTLLGLTIAVPLYGWLNGWLGGRLSGENPLRLQPPPCFEVGAPFHHRFRADCEETLLTPNGPVPFRTNEDGLRELARATVTAHPRRALFLGDSVVEGWWLAHEQALTTHLNRAQKNTYFINAGLRSTGPLFTARRLPALIAAYKPRAILYLLNENDVLDDRIACALAESRAGPPSTWSFTAEDFSLPGWASWPPARASGLYPVRSLHQAGYRARWRELVRSPAAAACEPCAGLREIQRLAKEAGTELKVARLKYQEYMGGGPYFQEPEAPSQQTACLSELGIRAATVEIRWADEAERERLFWPRDAHPSPAGMLVLAERLQRMLEKGGALE